jgi:hypothetical protein
MVGCIGRLEEWRKRVGKGRKGGKEEGEEGKRRDGTRGEVHREE